MRKAALPRAAFVSTNSITQGEQVGVLWGWLFWQDLPDAWAWSGIAVIVAAGVFVLRKTPETAEDGAAEAEPRRRAA